jgi:predicted PurR-regulated permease PerM
MTGRRQIEVSISLRTLLIAAGGVAAALALASIGDVLLTIFVSVFSVAVLSPVASWMERRLGWSRGLCAAALVVVIVVGLGGVVLVLVQAISGTVRGFSHQLPQIVDDARHSDLGNFLNRGGGWLETLKQHTSDITKGAGKVSGGVVHVGVSAFGAVTLFFSVIFLTLFGLT